jgi:hypothetical protein
MEVDNKSMLIVGEPQGILAHQSRPHLMNLLNIIIILISYSIKNYYIIS